MAYMHGTVIASNIEEYFANLSKWEEIKEVCTVSLMKRHGKAYDISFYVTQKRASICNGRFREQAEIVPLLPPRPFSYLCSPFLFLFCRAAPIQADLIRAELSLELLKSCLLMDCLLVGGQRSGSRVYPSYTICVDQRVLDHSKPLNFNVPKSTKFDNIATCCSASSSNGINIILCSRRL